MEKVTGYIDNFIYQNKENGYCVLTLVTEGGELTCVGTLQGVTAGMNVAFAGSYTEHPSYGRQFKVESYEEKEPEDEFAIERYLGSGAIKGIGAALAARIVRKFGKDTFRVIEEEPERLAEIRGISERGAQEIAAQVEEKKEMRQAMIFLQQFGITLALAAKVYQTYGPQIYTIIRENPYRMADDIQGVGFRIADEIAGRAGIRADSDFRIRSGILYALQQAGGEGHTYLPKEQLNVRVAQLLEIDLELIEKHYMDLAVARRIVIKQNGEEMQIYSSSYYNMEHNAALLLQELNVQQEVSEADLRTKISSIEKHTDVVLDELQREALCEAARNGLLIITGGPGTGKTTTINSIIRLYEMEGLDFMLAAPTGRAAKRMSETTGYEARTIHRMLELNGGVEGSAGFERNESNPLETDAIIIDEMSMVDITLMNSLLKAIAPATRLVLVGDINQLPSVGPGSVLKDMIDAGVYQVVRLTKIFRQASQSDIIVNAHRINRGESVRLDNQSRDFFFLKRYDADKIINVVLQLVIQKMPKYVDAQMYEIQVLTPMRKGLLGVDRLNTVLQQYLNPPAQNKAEKIRGEVIFREGDKVMQVKNNYQIEWEVKNRYGIAVEHGMGIFNGDMGVIRSIRELTEIVTIEFDEGRVVEYPFKMLEELELAYAITIHKSQGSEYPAVVIPLLSGPKMLMNRNLLYTAVTRAKKCVTLVGDEHTFTDMVDNISEQRRYCGLKDRIMEQADAGGGTINKK
ncbi:MAG: ATP-dependent RecD-like DNA helicase [Eubacterium sp.]|nr:ATP-dependent RecD-like DNA helicase [Eubacterium sp.]